MVFGLTHLKVLSRFVIGWRASKHAKIWSNYTLKTNPPITRRLWRRQLTDCNWLQGLLSEFTNVKSPNSAYMNIFSEDDNRDTMSYTQGT